MVSAMIQPENVLEVGTFTGYSTICFARGLSKTGHIDTIEINPELYDFAHKYFIKGGLLNRITQHIGNAMDIIPSLKKQWDLVFLDADKENYLNYYKLLIDKVKKGGFILADNVLWDGKVLNPEKYNDKETLGIVNFNNFVKNDERVQNLLLPLRDGIMVLQKL
jgi:predicted O-methyltransferase YrrM